MKKIAILASGSGSNAEKIMEYFSKTEKAQVSLVASNKKEAFVLERAKKYNVPSFTFSKKELESGMLTAKLLSLEIDLVVLAGFLLKIPDEFIKNFPDKIVNIHPALLPKHGGKGMYGMYVHQAVKDAGDKETGITIHLVNENYDEGKVIFQAGVEVLEKDSPEDIANKVHELEHKYFPNVIESLL
ncbi:phosphoribosylglycinamide formyltransferase, formyltetrahydrofolate-dependent [Belliella baltica DSM 15883]|uniref:Phosphoribosylglycinamide formyltransferase n=1 Tax=Belliella baltica (strain DSM 15883 / CIP 108006 / LMG 21964 / BA134) TaxID=866536 RepID=I3Z174_BELBD|nr:phosphoribosylglycinamide formyltransferase [Belliella baltica]AFL82992.1 phosphoribosylglycinamide formyltransferase, formyltetrahydrofolate-dependent [Belliella baltica DSM 15883]